ncbi:hypothetical protein Y032_0036g3256 [Ancylostoma ceylanicum]|uniref:Uncharacterized protein n=1 Tax=Ancylostoma ceylanicum TaxID=53326 RepID=A0A016UJT2_9BILA|nr:hypothetical protein Y032_0036g3256 [Ancylostoma ceylanicum]
MWTRNPSIITSQLLPSSPQLLLQHSSTQLQLSKNGSNWGKDGSSWEKWDCSVLSDLTNITATSLLRP